MHKERRGAGTGKRSGHFPANMPGFAHAHNHHFARAIEHFFARLRKVLIDVLIQFSEAFTFNLRGPLFLPVESQNPAANLSAT